MLQTVRRWVGSAAVAEEPELAPVYLDVEQLRLGASLTFAESAPEPLSAQQLHVVGIYQYQFEEETIDVYRLKAEGLPIFQLVVSEDEEGHYLGLSRLVTLEELNSVLPHQQSALEQGRALALPKRLTEQTEWFAERYRTELQDVKGTVTIAALPEGGVAAMGREFRYTLFAGENEGCALEVEEYQDGTYQLFCTVYAGIEAIEEIAPPPQNAVNSIGHEQTLAAQPTTVFAEEVQSLTQWLDEPDAVQMPMPTTVALGLLNDALYSGKRVSDVLREQCGLDVLGKEEVAMTMQLREADYKELAMRYGLKASNKEAIHERLRESVIAHYLGEAT